MVRVLNWQRFFSGKKPELSANRVVVLVMILPGHPDQPMKLYRLSSVHHQPPSWPARDSASINLTLERAILVLSSASLVKSRVTTGIDNGVFRYPSEDQIVGSVDLQIRSRVRYLSIVDMYETVELPPTRLSISASHVDISGIALRPQLWEILR